MDRLSAKFFAAFWIAALGGLLYACSGGQFAAGSSKGSASPKKLGGGKTDLTGQPDGNDDGADGPTSGKDGKDAGDDTGKDEGADDGTAKDGKDGKNGDDDGTGDDGKIDGKDDAGEDDGKDDIGLDDGNNTANLKSDLTIATTRDDECGDGNVMIRVETFVDGEVKGSAEVKCPKKGGSVVVPGACRKAKTCLKVTFIADKTQDTWANQVGCVFTSGSGNPLNIDFDSNGSGFLGKCAPGEDDTVTLSCDTKALSVVNCN